MPSKHVGQKHEASPVSAPLLEAREKEQSTEGEKKKEFMRSRTTPHRNSYL